VRARITSAAPIPSLREGRGSSPLRAGTVFLRSAPAVPHRSYADPGVLSWCAWPSIFEIRDVLTAVVLMNWFRVFNLFLPLPSLFFLFVQFSLFFLPLFVRSGFFSFLFSRSFFMVDSRTGTLCQFSYFLFFFELRPDPTLWFCTQRIYLQGYVRSWACFPPLSSCARLYTPQVYPSTMRVLRCFVLFRHPLGS